MSWKNLTKPCVPLQNLRIKNCEDAISYMKYHALKYPTIKQQKTEPEVYITICTLDQYFLIYRYVVCQSDPLIQKSTQNKENKGHHKMLEILQIKTEYPIYQNILTYQKIENQTTYTLMVYLSDIYGNLYKLNTSSIISHKIKNNVLSNMSDASSIIDSKYKKLQSMPTLYDKLYQNKSLQTRILEEYLQDKTSLYKETIVLMYKYNENIYIFNYRGEVKIIGSKDLLLIKEFTFEKQIVCAEYIQDITKQAQESIFCITFNNDLPPFIFSCRNSQNINNLKKQYEIRKQYYLENQNTCDDLILQMSYDKQTKTLVCRNNKDVIELYTILNEEIKQKKPEITSYLIAQKQFSFNGREKMSKKQDMKIEYMHANHGFLTIFYYELAIIFNLKQREYASGKKDSNKQLRWTILITVDEDFFIILMAKGYHEDPQKCKLGKPALHIYYVSKKKV